MGHDRHDELLEALQEQIDRLTTFVDGLGPPVQPASEDVVLTNRITHEQLRIPVRELMLWRDCGNPDYSLVGHGGRVYAVCESIAEVQMRVRAAKAEGELDPPPAPVAEPCAREVEAVADPTPEQLREVAEGLAAEEEAAEAEPQPGPGEIVLTAADTGEPVTFEAKRLFNIRSHSDTCHGSVTLVTDANSAERQRAGYGVTSYVREPVAQVQAAVDAALDAVAEGEPKTVTLHSYCNPPNCVLFETITSIEEKAGWRVVRGRRPADGANLAIGFWNTITETAAEIIAAALKAGVPCVGEELVEVANPQDCIARLEFLYGVAQETIEQVKQGRRTAWHERDEARGERHQAQQQRDKALGHVAELEAQLARRDHEHANQAETIRRLIGSARELVQERDALQAQLADVDPEQESAE